MEFKSRKMAFPRRHRCLCFGAAPAWPCPFAAAPPLPWACRWGSQREGEGWGSVSPHVSILLSALPFAVLSPVSQAIKHKQWASPESGRVGIAPPPSPPSKQTSKEAAIHFPAASPSAYYSLHRNVTYFKRDMQGLFVISSSPLVCVHMCVCLCVCVLGVSFGTRLSKGLPWHISLMTVLSACFFFNLPQTHICLQIAFNEEVFEINLWKQKLLSSSSVWRAAREAPV